MSTLDARRIALKLAAKLCNDVQRPDAQTVIDMAERFETYLTGGDNGKAAPAKSRKDKPQKPQTIAK